MALCPAESLIERNGFDPLDRMQRYLRWYKHGTLSCTGICFDIGSTTRGALIEFEKTGEPYCGGTDPKTAGNGSIMRPAPVAMFFARNPAEAVARAADRSRTTHGATAAIDSCRYLAWLIVRALNGVGKRELLEPCPLSFGSDEGAEVAAGSFKHLEPPEIKATGYCVKTLQAALWAFHRTDSYKEGCLKAVNLGDDSDTVGAVFGQPAGAFYGARGIPDAWPARPAYRKMIESYAEKIHRAASR